MSNKKYDPTKAQSIAIGFSGTDLLVSAGAGSGKTTTLADRIRESIEQKNGDIARKLVVTFTRESANDLRAKLSASLAEILAKNPSEQRIADQKSKLDSADICTIDAFCLKLVRENFEKLGIEGGFRIADESEREVLCRDAMSEVIDELAELGESGFISVRECFGKFSSEERLKDGLLKLYKELLATDRGIEKLNDSSKTLKGDLMDTVYGEVLRQDALDAFEYINEEYEDLRYIDPDSLEANEYGEALASDFALINSMLALLRDKKSTYAQTKDVISVFEMKSKKTVKKEPKLDEETKAEFDKKRKTLKDAVERLKPLFSLTQDRIEWDFEQNSRMCKEIYKVLLAFDQRYMEKKTSAGVRDFNDITRYALELLYDENDKITPLAERLKESYDEIYVDEYQDTNSVQDKIFRAFSNDNRFLVGDIKQSIYMFRAANPDIFSGYRRSFKQIDVEKGIPDAKELKKELGFVGAQIAMRENFRCAEGIIGFSNAVSNYMFETLESIPYKRDEDELVFKSGERDEAHPVPEVYLIDKDGEYLNEADKPAESSAESAEKATEETPMSAKESLEKKLLGSDTSDDDELKGVEIEAELVAYKIQQLIADSKRESLAESDKEARKKKLIEAKDITILMRAFTDVDIYREALAKRGIKSTYNAESQFFEKSEILLTLCTLNAIDNPLRDAYLAGAMRSFVFGFDADDLARVKSEEKGKIKDMRLYDALKCYKGNALLEAKIDAFLAKLEAYRQKCRALSCAEAISFIYADAGFLNRATRGQRQSLLKLYDMARSYEAGKSKGLYGFLRYIEGIKDGKDRESFGDIGENAVRIMTIHGSKGLEFKACFVCSCGRKFKTTFDDIIFTNKLGVNTYVFPENALIKHNTLLREIAEIAKKRESIEEEMRMLYVAMTRAKSRLFITGRQLGTERGTLLEYKDKQEKSSARAYSTLNAGSYMGWILRAIHKTPSVAKLTLIGKKEMDELGAELEGDDYKITVSERTTIDKCASAEQIKSRFEFKYPYEHLSELPSKLSISQINDQNKQIAEGVDKKTTYTPKADENKIDVEPEFRVKKVSTSADKGTATHVFMQFCDFDRLERDGFDAEKQRLEASGYMSSEMTKLVEKEHIEKLISSDNELLALIKRVGKDNLWRELRFNILLDAVEVTSNPDLNGEQILVQGVCDLVLKDGEKIILVDYKTDNLKNDSFLQKNLKERYSAQLEYYKKACEQMFGRVDGVYIYSVPHAKLLAL